MTHDYPPLSGGGLALAVHDLSRALAAMPGVEVSVLSSRLRDHCTDDRRASGPGASAGDVRWRRAPRRRTVAWLRSADLVCAHWTFSFRWLATASMLLGPRLGVPTICVVHTAPAHAGFNRLRHLPGWARCLLVRLIGAGMRPCAAVVALGPTHASELTAAGLPVTHVLPLVVRTPPPRRAAPGGNAGAGATVGIAGELSRLKGADRIPGLVRALTPDLGFRIAGAGPLARPIGRCVAGLPPAQRARVTLLGWIDAAAMPSFYAVVDVLLVLSRTEAQSRVVLEAMLAGVVVVTSADRACPDLVVPDVTGVVVDVDDPVACRRRILGLVGDPGRMAALRAAARRRATAVVDDAATGWRRLVADALAPDQTDQGCEGAGGASGTSRIAWSA
jgi:glycosyltransferase involved in cell wall biosynthesis